MNHPLKWYHWAGRELICYVKGHSLRSSWKQKKNYKELADMEYEDIPYADRCHKNPYFEYAAWWTAKCRRCRTKWNYSAPNHDSFPVTVTRGLFWSLHRATYMAQFFVENGRWIRYPLSVPFWFVTFFSSFLMYIDCLWTWVSMLLSSAELYLYEVKSHVEST